MELPSNLLEQMAFNSIRIFEDHLLIVMKKSTLEKHLSQPLQTNNKQFKIAVTLQTGYNGIFKVTNENNKFYFRKTITYGDGFIQITIPPGAYEIETLNNEIKKIIIDEEHYTESNYPFTIQPNFSALGSFIKISPEGPIISFMFDDSVRDLLGLSGRELYGEYTFSSNHVNILSFDIFFLETDIAQGMIDRGRRSGIIHKMTMTVDPGYKYVESFRGGITWYMMKSKMLFQVFVSN